MEQRLTVMSTLAVELALKSILLPAWHETGRTAKMEWSPTGLLIARVRKGERADVLIAIDEPVQSLASEGVLVPGSIRPLAQASFGLGARRGAPMPDISTPDRFRDTLLSARSVCYSQSGASGIHFQDVLQRLEISAAVKRKATVISEGFTASKVISGMADLAVQQISELMSIDGIDVVGPFPEPFQKRTDFSAAIFTKAQNPDAAAAFLNHLSNDNAAAAYGRSGLSPRLAAAQ